MGDRLPRDFTAEVRSQFTGAPPSLVARIYLPGGDERAVTTADVAAALAELLARLGFESDEYALDVSGVPPRVVDVPGGGGLL